MRPLDVCGASLTREAADMALDVSGFLTRVRAGKKVCGPARRRLLELGLITEGRNRDWLTPRGREWMERHRVRDLGCLGSGAGIGVDLSALASDLFAAHARRRGSP